MPRPSFSLSTSLVFIIAITHLSAQSPTPPPRPLVANGDKYTLHPGGQERLPVLSNDYAKVGKIDSQTLVIETPPTQGQAIVLDGGIIEYTHTGAGFENDSLVYRVATREGESATAKVSITLSNKLRLINATLNVPAAPPSTAYEWTDALPGLRFDEPCGLESIVDQSPRLFVLEKKTGIIRMVPDLTAPKPESQIFLDLNALLKSRGEKLATSSEQGLTGIAFHPKQAENRQFFVFYSITKQDGQSYERVSRFERRADRHGWRMLPLRSFSSNNSIKPPIIKAHRYALGLTAISTSPSVTKAARMTNTKTVRTSAKTSSPASCASMWTASPAAWSLTRILPSPSPMAKPASRSRRTIHSFIKASAARGMASSMG